MFIKHIVSSSKIILDERVWSPEKRARMDQKIRIGELSSVFAREFVN